MGKSKRKPRSQAPPSGNNGVAHEAQGREDTRPEIKLSADEHRCVEEVVKALAKRDAALYQRGGELVRVVRPSAPRGDERIRPSGALRIERIPSAALRLRITKAARLQTYAGKDAGWVPAHPGEWLVEGTANLGAWRRVRHLEAVVESPVLRPDGSILARPGYDRQTGLLFRPRGAFPAIPAAPTRADAERACVELLEVLNDFPFAKPQHRSGALSGILTPLGRFAFEGPSPWHVIDANLPGAGKGLLADAMGVTALGRVFARAAYTSDNTEMGKAITALGLSGEVAILWDNLAGSVGGANLDAALTSTVWQGRILGRSKQAQVPLRVAWFGTGNNCLFRGDTARRVLQIRLESPEEKPEERVGFKHPDLLAWIRQERGRLLVAGLTVLTAFCHAGRPMPSGLKPWGSYESWSNLVRAALVWAGQPDPGECRMSAVAGGDREVTSLRGLLDGWRELDPNRNGLTVAAALDLLKGNEGGLFKGDEDKYPTMRAVLADVFDLPPGKLPGSGRLGYKLRSFAGRLCGGECFVGELGHGGVQRWRVRTAPAPGGDVGDGGDSPTNLIRTRTHAGEVNPVETCPPSPPCPPPPPEGDWFEEDSEGPRSAYEARF